MPAVIVLAVLAYLSVIVDVEISSSSANSRCSAVSMRADVCRHYASPPIY